MVKRAFDLIASGAALIVLALPLGVVIVVLRLTGEGEVWYRQERVGRGGRTFSILKFATMRAGSETMVAGAFTLRDDPRVLPVGRLLRKTKINELPQLINVLKGEMSVVGWRPVVPSSFLDYPVPFQEKIIELRPGLTGMGSLVFRDEETILERARALRKPPLKCFREDIKPYKSTLELWYQEHLSLWLDLKIISATAWTIVRPDDPRWRRWFKGLPAPESPLLRIHMGYPSEWATS